jgi:polysaccharide export outer membrane protein
MESTRPFRKPLFSPAVGATTVRAVRALAVMILLGLGLLGCPSRPPNHPYEKEPDPRKTEYIIGVADTLRISVWKNAELNTEISVRPDGTITIPLIGDIRAEGLTPSQLRDQLKKRLRTYIREEEAVVTVAVTAINSYSVTVAGNVTAPGRYSSSSYLTVADAIALAGGPNRFASADEAIVLRPGPSGVRRIPVNYEQIREGKFLQQNLVLMRGDQVFVP